MVKLYIEAKKFIIKQRLEELRRANQHWPNSKHQEERNIQISELERSLQELDEKE